MSGLVFVQDAQSRPLMPMSAAYARTLIQQGKGQMIPHPAVSIIQLTRSVVAPTLRPVVLGLVLNSANADITLLMEQARSSPTSFQIAIDVRGLPLLSQPTHQRWRFHPRRVRRIQDARVGFALRKYASMLTAAISACQHLIPISHLILLPSHRTSALPPVRAAWITRQIQRRISNISILHEDEQVTEQLSTLTQILTSSPTPSTVHIPDMVCVTKAYSRISDQQRMSENQRSQSVHIGRLCTVRHAGRAITGIIQELDQLDHLLLWVPTHVEDQGVRWQNISIQSYTALHLWPVTPILMIPLDHARHRSKRPS